MKSRPKRWAEAAAKANEALSELQSIKEEYQDWLDNLPENLQNSALGEKLQAITDLDIDSAVDVSEEAMNIDLPLGFGRD